MSNRIQISFFAAVLLLAGAATAASAPDFSALTNLVRDWADAYPWIDKAAGVRVFFIAHIDQSKPNPKKFSGFYSSPALAMMVREALAAKDNPRAKK